VSDSTNMQLVCEAFDAFERGDVDWMRGEHLADDLVWHVGGHNRFSGDYPGRAGMLQLFASARHSIGGTLRFTPNEIIVEAHHAVVLGKGSARNSKG
jgi:ketosteroid isomerase-like protein